jgi:hypothetical protein
LQSLSQTVLALYLVPAEHVHDAILIQ